MISCHTSSLMVVLGPSNNLIHSSPSFIIPHKVSSWQWKRRPAGPVGILVQNLGQRNAHLGDQWALRSRYTPTFNLHEEPLQFSKRAVYMIPEGSSFRVMVPFRKAFRGIFRIDRHATMAAIRTSLQPLPTDEDFAPPVSEAERMRRDARKTRLVEYRRCSGLPIDRPPVPRTVRSTPPPAFYA